MPRPFAALRRRLDVLEQKLPPPPPPLSAEEEQRLRRIGARLDRLLRAVEPLLSADEAVRVHEALDLWDRGEYGPFTTWFRDLTEGRSTLPDITPATMKALLLAWLSPERDSFARVCRQCGLEYPDHQKPPLSQWRLRTEPGPPWYDTPDFFAACPCCGASVVDFDWAHLVEGKEAPWKQQARKRGVP